MKGQHQEDIEAVTSEVTVIPNTPNDLLSTLIHKGADFEMIKMFMDLRDRDDAREAKKEYLEAVSQFKQEPIEVVKDKINKHTNNSSYASLGNLMGTVNPILSKYGLSARIDIDDKTNPEMITVACILSHVGGHSERAEMSGPPDTKGPKGEANKTEIHGRLSTLTYLTKATYGSVTGIAAIDEKFDDDGNAAGGSDFITEGQVTILTTLSKKAKLNDDDIARFLEVVDAVEVRTISKAKYAEATKLLDKAVGNMKKREAK